MPESFFEAGQKDNVQNAPLPNFDQEILAMFPVPSPRSERAATFIERYDHSGHWADHRNPDGMISERELGKITFLDKEEDRKLGEKLEMAFDTVKTLNNDETGFECNISKADLISYLRLQDLSANSMSRLSTKLKDLPEADRAQAGRILDSLLSRDYESYRHAIKFFEGKPDTPRVLAAVTDELRDISNKATGRNRVTIYDRPQSISVGGQKDSIYGTSLSLTVSTDGQTENYQEQAGRYPRNISNESIFNILSMRVSHAVLESADK